jgi:hypothetical protein
VESRFEALHTTGLTALVGREEESELLLRCWARAKVGGGQVVLDAASLLWGLFAAFIIESVCGCYTTANARVDELVALADEKDAAQW